MRDLQHDALEWQQAGGASVTPMLPANAPALAALALPDFYAISHAAAIGIDAQLAALQRALERGLRLVQLREPDLPAAQKAAFCLAAIALCRRFGARVLINADAALAQQAGADGLHLTARQLMALGARPNFPLVAASCHDARELAQAARLGLDFVVLGPVNETASHPGRAGIGWQAWSALVAGTPLPVYAIGGLALDDMQSAWNAGAHGIAAIRAAWRV